MYSHLDDLDALYSISEEPVDEFAGVEMIPVVNANTLFPEERKSLSFSFSKIKVLKEMKIFIIIFLIVLSAFFFFTNAKLVLFTFNDTFVTEPEESVEIMTEDFQEHSSAQEINLVDKQEKILALEESFDKIQKNKREEQNLALSMEEFLDKKQETHTLNFNTLPPTNRLIIPSLNVNVPLIDAVANWVVDLANANYDEELMQGVVKYPTTAEPWSQWNTLIFGHSSTERWKHNEYWFIFRSLPKLQVWDRFQIIWNGQLYTYEMVESKIVYPKEVPDYYQQYHDTWKNYVTLMGCYPIWSNAKRMMVVAELVKD